MTESIDYKGYTINIDQDVMTDDPRNWDNLGVMVCSHRRYNLGDKTFASEDFNGWNDLYFYLQKEEGAIILLPLFLYDHSGISMSTSIESHWWHAEWDSGQVGYIYITKEKACKEFNWKRITKARRAKLVNILVQEVETYNQYLTDDVWFSEILDAEGEQCDSCGGFYGYDYCLSAAKEMIDYYTREK